MSLNLECTPGYTGPSCTEECPYPTYGSACQGFCNCSNDTCNLSWGCITSTTLTTGGYFCDIHNLPLNHKKLKKKRFHHCDICFRSVSSLKQVLKENVTNYKTYFSRKSFGTSKSELVQIKSGKNIASFLLELLAD